jgi:hypothetical protein
LQGRNLFLKLVQSARKSEKDGESGAWVRGKPEQRMNARFTAWCANYSTTLTGFMLENDNLAFQI